MNKKLLIVVSLAVILMGSIAIRAYAEGEDAGTIVAKPTVTADGSTNCPIVKPTVTADGTECPMPTREGVKKPTICPPHPTRCVADTAANCPQPTRDATGVKPTKCPPKPTVCPPHPTRCVTTTDVNCPQPTRNAAGVKPTKCPPKPTKCPVVKPTKCPPKPNVCPIKPTRDADKKICPQPIGKEETDDAEPEEVQ
ncbi:hypothetical protein HY793_02225 [Candidatus Desantisbacteria bacterium]|nr:hypothetical protein [Candidatus Desantisbacteria bacterium]